MKLEKEALNFDVSFYQMLTQSHIVAQTDFSFITNVTSSQRNVVLCLEEPYDVRNSAVRDKDPCGSDN